MSKSKSVYALPKTALITCGGTIGGEWSAAHDTVVPSRNGNKRLIEYIESQVQPHRKLAFVDLFNKDSRAVTDADRDRLMVTVKRLRKRGIRYFLVTHGTFTMAQTGAYLDARLAAAGIEDVYIVLCGSMIPNTGFAPSDAQFNIGFALAKLSMLGQKEQAGAWVCMNGLLSRPESITKNVKKARFEIKKKS